MSKVESNHDGEFIPLSEEKSNKFIKNDQKSRNDK
jgi:hypothetical protein